MKRIIAAAVIAAILILSLVSVSAEGDTVAGLDLSYTVKDNGNIIIDAAIVDINDPVGLTGVIYYVRFNQRLLAYVGCETPVPAAWESLTASDIAENLFYKDPFSNDNTYVWLETVVFPEYAIKADNQLRIQIELEPIITNIDLQIEFVCDSLYNDSPTMEPLQGTSKTLTINKSDLKPIIDSSSKTEESSKAVSSEIDITSDIPVSEPSVEPSVESPSVESSEIEIPMESSAEIEIPNISIGELLPSEDESSAEELLPSEDESSAEEMIPSEDESSAEESISSEEAVSSEDEDISAEISSEIESESSSVEDSIEESDPSDVESAESDSNTLENASSEDANSIKSDDDDDGDDDDDDDRVKSKKDNNTLIWVIVSVAAVVIIGAAVTVVILLRKKKVN